MAVWVDPLKDWGWRLGPSCHLMADTKEELHEFAERIGMKRAWFQDAPRLWHYDLTASKRAKALKAGALDLTYRGSFERINAREGLTTSSPLVGEDTTAESQPS